MLFKVFTTDTSFCFDLLHAVNFHKIAPLCEYVFVLKNFSVLVEKYLYNIAHIPRANHGMWDNTVGPLPRVTYSRPV